MYEKSPHKDADHDNQADHGGVKYLGKRLQNKSKDAKKGKGLLLSMETLQDNDKGYSARRYIE